jgi:hypothetical protein
VGRPPPPDHCPRKGTAFLDAGWLVFDTFTGEGCLPRTPRRPHPSELCLFETSSHADAWAARIQGMAYRPRRNSLHPGGFPYGEG